MPNAAALAGPQIPPRFKPNVDCVACHEEFNAATPHSVAKVYDLSCVR